MSGTTAPLHRWHGLWTSPRTLLQFGLFLAAIVLATNVLVDPDLWGHVRFGGDIARDLALHDADPYSYTSDRRWINHEWLAEVLMYGAYRAGGATGLVLFKAAIVLGLLGVVLWSVRISTAQPAPEVVVGLALAGMYLRLETVRPQLFSLMLFAVLLYLLRRTDEGRWRALIAVPPLMVLWVNLHGGWLVGIGVMGIWSAFAALDRRQKIPQRLFAVGVASAALLATLVNPYGVEMWRFLGATVRFERADIMEWHPVYAIPLGAAVPWAIAAGAAFIALLAGGLPRNPAYLAIIGVLGVAAFRVNRLDAFFALAVVIFLAPGIAKTVRDRTAATRRSVPPHQVRWFALVTVTAAALMALPAARIVHRNLSCIELGASWLPEAEAGAFIGRNQLHGRLLIWFDWGEYAIWHFAPALQVSLDGRRETVYGHEVLTQHYVFFRNEPEALSVLQRLAPDHIWLPNELPVVAVLEGWGWLPVFKGSVSTIFSRSPTIEKLGASESPVGGPRCFPGF